MAAVAALCWVAITGIFVRGEELWPVAALVGLTFLVGPLLHRHDDEPQGVPLDPRANPILHRELATACADAGLSVSRILLSNRLGASIELETRAGRSRPILLLGLATLGIVSPPQLRALVLHQALCGREWNSLTGRFAQRTSQAISCTAGMLENLFGPLAALHRYAERQVDAHALRWMQRFARRADEVTAQDVGLEAHLAALRSVSAASRVYDRYWEACEQVWAHHQRLALCEGFREALAGVDLEEALRDVLRDDPDLADRLQRAGAEEAASWDPLSGRATQLADDLDGIERAFLLDGGAPRIAIARPPVAWSEVPRILYEPEWRETQAITGVLLARRTVKELPASTEDWERLGRALFGPCELMPEPHWLVEYAAQMVAECMSASLVAHGWTAHVSLTEAPTLTKDGASIQPSAVLFELAHGELAPWEWNARCRALGIADLDLVGDTQPVRRGEEDPSPLASWVSDQLAQERAAQRLSLVGFALLGALAGAGFATAELPMDVLVRHARWLGPLVGVGGAATAYLLRRAREAEPAAWQALLAAACPAALAYWAVGTLG